MKPGIYRLARDVKNPQKIDRRRTDWWHRDGFKAGEIFIVSNRAIDFDALPEKPLLFIGLRNPSGFWNYQTFRRQEVLTTLLLASAKQIEHEKDVKWMLMYFSEVECKGVSYEAVVRFMLEKKFLSLDMIKGICEEMK